LSFVFITNACVLTKGFSQPFLLKNFQITPFLLVGLAFYYIAQLQIVFLKLWSNIKCFLTIKKQFFWKRDFEILLFLVSEEILDKQLDFTTLGTSRYFSSVMTLYKCDLVLKNLAFVKENYLCIFVFKTEFSIWLLWIQVISCIIFS
jgi:hypothetical protein